MSLITKEAIEGKKVNIKEFYNLPEKVIHCSKCVVSNQRPRIILMKIIFIAHFFSEIKNNHTDWVSREKELIDLLNKHRRKDGYWDVVVPCSGGKDSVYVAHILKEKYNMNPLTVTWAPMLYTDVGWRNLHNMIDSGIDNILGTPDGKTHRILTKLSLEIMGDVFQPFIYGQKGFPMAVAINYKIPLVMYGENGEVEYGGSLKNADVPTHNVSDDMIKHYFSGMHPEDFEKYGIDKRKLNYYYPPKEEAAKEVGLENHFMSYYQKWIPQENYYYSVENCGFEPEPSGRSEGTYSKYASLDDKMDGMHYYMRYIKFGLGRCIEDAAHEIRDGHISREEGVRLVEKYDGEFPKKHFKEFLNYVDMTEEEFFKVCDRFRAEHLWDLHGDQWSLKKPVWK